MAARPPKPPELVLSNEEAANIFVYDNQQKFVVAGNNAAKIQNSLEHQQNRCVDLATKSECSCTNISIMHLFHEMKQKFPTVPDNIVNQCVLSNCHDRENCIRSLQTELNLHSTASQSYPSNALRNQNNSSNFTVLPIPQPTQNLNNTETTLPSAEHYVANKKIEANKKSNVLKPTRPAPVPQAISKTVNCDVKNNLNLNNNNPFNNNNPVRIGDSKPDDKFILAPPKRPTSLKFCDPILQDTQSNSSDLQCVKKTNCILLKPTRKAPAPPVSITSPSGANLTPLSSSSSQQATPTSYSHKVSSYPNSSNVDHSYSSSIQSPFSDSPESEISVNISVSPTFDSRSRITTTTTGQHAQPQTPRRITSVTLQPEPPYTRDFIQQQNPSSQRSYTSLNLTLRKPSSKPQSPIDITAGPGLTYSSSSFDAGRGLQKCFHISVNSEGGVFRASSIRPKSCYIPPIPHPEEEFQAVQHQSVLRPASSEQNFYRNITDVSRENFHKNDNIINSSLIKQDFVNVELIERQKGRKEKLIKAIEKNRKKLKQVQAEICIIKTVELPCGGSERLDYDIEVLRDNCKLLLNEIENSKRLVDEPLPTRFGNELTGSSNQFRQKPPRPPPCRLVRLTTSQSANNPVELMGDSSSISSSSLPANLNSVATTLQTNQATALNNIADEDGPQWSCKHCTFLNDPLMIRCENCENDREIPGRTNTSSFSNNENFNSFPPINSDNNVNKNNNNNNINEILTSAMSTQSAYVENNSFENNNLHAPTPAYNCS